MAGVDLKEVYYDTIIQRVGMGDSPGMSLHPLNDLFLFIYFYFIYFFISSE